MKVKIKLEYADPKKQPVVGTIELDKVIDATIVNWHGMAFRFAGNLATIREAVYMFREDRTWVDITETLEVIG